MEGLVLHIQGSMSALLDGHHRATAACLYGQSLGLPDHFQN